METKNLIYVACALILLGLFVVLPVSAAPPTGDIDLEKEVSVNGGVTWLDADTAPGPMLLAIGAAPQFRFNITNIGEATLNSITLTDTALGAITLPSTTLQRKTSMVVVMTGTWGAGQQTATATVTSRRGSVDHTDSDPTNYFGAAPAIDVEKYVSVDGGATWDDADAAPGPTSSGSPAPQFKFVVTNPGNVGLSSVALTDTILGAIAVPATLAVGGNVERVVTGTWAAGQQTSTATATGSFTDTAGTTASRSDSDAANYFGGTAQTAIDLETYVSIDGGSTFIDADSVTGPMLLASGAAPQFRFVVTNTGNVVLSSVAVTDTVFGTITVPATLAVGGSAERVVTGSWAAGQQTNTATAIGTGAGQTVSDSDAAHYYGAAPAIDVEKYVSVDGGSTWIGADSAPGPDCTSGLPPQFKFVVVNTGNVALSNVGLSDNVYGGITVPATLAVGGSAEAVLTAPWQAGQHTNVATASGSFTDDAGTTASGSESDAANYFGIMASISIKVFTNGDDADTPTGPSITVGAPVLWTYVVTNMGNVALTDVAVTDDQGVTVTAPKTMLAPGESMTATASGIAQPCQYSNIGTVTGTPPSGPVVTANNPSHYFGLGNPALTIEVRTNGDDADTPPGPTITVGAAVTWTYLVTNIGDVPLTNVQVIDDQGVTVTAPKTVLAPGESMTATASGTAVAGQYANIGTVTGTPPCGSDVTASDPSHYNGAASPAPSVSVKVFTNGDDADTPPGPSIPVGGAVTWTYIVTNTGNVALTSVAVTDDQGVTVTAPKTVLAPGESMTATASGTAVAGQYANVGTVSGTPPIGQPVTGSDPSHYFGLSLPVASFTANPTSGYAPLTVSFTNTSSGAIDSGLWDFGDGTTSTEQNPTHTFTAPGTYTVTLTVTNAAGPSSTTRTVSVAQPSVPGANFTANVTEGAAPLAVQFTDTSTGGVYYWGWDFGDGATSTDPNPVHTYTKPGTYLVSLLASNYVQYDIRQMTITVTAAAPSLPVANFTANATSGLAPLAVRFADTSTGGGITAWSWEFGDGGSSVEQNPIHVYAVPGTYSVNLTVTNAGGSATEAKAWYVMVITNGPVAGGDRGYYLVTTVPSGAEIYLESISGTLSSQGNTTAGPLNVTICRTCTPVRKLIAKLSGYSDAVYNITQYPPKGETVPVLLTLEPLATPSPTPTPTPVAGIPYPRPHPAGARIEAEDFDSGGEGVAYHDIDPANLGGAYRPAEGVDVETVEGVTDVGWIREGEYLDYTVDSTAAGSFTPTLMASNPDATAKVVRVYLDDVPAVEVLVAGTGSWTTYREFSSASPLTLPAGRHVVTLAFVGVNRLNIDWLCLSAGTAPTSTVTTTTTPAPSGGAAFTAAPVTAPHGAAVKFTVIPAAGKSISAAWWSFDAPAHLNTWNSRTINPTFYYPAAGTFSPLVKLTYTDGTTETVQKTGYIRAT